MEYNMVWVRGHIEVYDGGRALLFFGRQRAGRPGRELEGAA